MAETSITGLWYEIESIEPPERISFVETERIPLLPSPSPSGLPDKAAPIGWWIGTGLVFGILVALLALAPHLWWYALLPAAAVAAWHRIRGRARRVERRHREALLAEASRRYAAVTSEADQLGPVGFAELKGRLQRSKHEFEVEIADQQREWIAKFDAQAEARQLERHLATSYIRDARIPGLGPARKVTLEESGVRSAADVRPESIQNLPGFGAVLTKLVLAWREVHVKNFRFDPLEPTTAKARADGIAVFEARRLAVLASLQDGRDELQRRSKIPDDQWFDMAQRLAAAAEEVEQAKLDIRVL
ncbi:hypothetical protein [Tessaracoccus defluvii]|uniref:hypothetical protein n=1 Tax=Tessaracoccus defluvii TaxID=1285901 RepID=UPI0031D25803